MDRSDTTVLILGIILIMLGFIIRYIVGRRRFYRRTFGRTQQFENYNKALVIPIVEKFLLILSTLMILAGLFLTGLWYYNSK